MSLNVNNKPKVSIIVPIYNVSEYLADCLDCLLNQSLKDIEFILINDGSQDNSLEICKKYEIKDSRIKIINQLNGGVSNARNNGLKLAGGEFIGFVDPDDTFDKLMFEKMYNQAKSNQSDICICNYNRVENNSYKKETSIVNAIYRESFEKNTLLEQFLGSADFSVPPKMATVWRTIISRELLLKNNIIFNESVSIMEDLLFIVETTIVADKITYLDEALYNYYLRKNSAVTSFKTNFEKNNTEVFRSLRELVFKYGLGQELNIALSVRYIYMTIANINNIAKSDNGFIQNYKFVKKILNHPDLKLVFDKIPLNVYGINNIYVHLMKRRAVYLILIISKLRNIN